MSDSGTASLVYRTSGIGGGERLLLQPDSAGAAVIDSADVAIAVDSIVSVPQTGRAYTFNNTSSHSGGDRFLRIRVIQLADSILADWAALSQRDPAIYPMTGTTFTVDGAALPKGGLFDISGNWTPPHRLHRTGTDLDVNNVGAEVATARRRMARHCSRYYFHYSATDSVAVRCEFHANHYHILLGRTP